MIENSQQDLKKVSTTARMQHLKKKIRESRTSDPEDLMLIIMSVLKEDSLYPEVGKFYTFVYNPKTAKVRYDQHPLIVCESVHKWGFQGINFHWRKHKRYTWEEVVGKLYSIQFNELDEMFSIPYAKFKTNK